MRILVLGGYGAMGSVACRDLVESGAEVFVAGRDYEKAQNFAAKLGKNAIPTRIDVQDKNLVKEIKSLSPDVVLNATWYHYNMLAMSAAIKAKVNYVDLGGLYHMTLKQLKLHQRAKRAGVLCLLGMGSTPGTTNIMGHYAAHHFDNVAFVSIRSGWRVLQKTKKPVLPYTATTIIDEFTNPAPILRDGKIKFVNPLKTKVSFEFPKPLGKVSGHFTIHSELATMPKYLDKGIKEMDFAVAYPPEFTKLVESIIKKHKKREQQVKALQQAVEVPKQDPKDIDGQRIEISGWKNKKPLTVKLEAITTYHKKWKRGSAIDTGVPASIAAQWIANGKIKSKGVLPPGPVFHGKEKEYFKALYKHTSGNIRIII